MAAIIFNWWVKLFGFGLDKCLPGSFDEVVVKEDINLLRLVGMQLLFEGLVNEFEILFGGFGG